MVAGSSRVLMVLSTAPGIGTPKCASSIAGTFGSIADTVSPGRTPWRASAEASRRARSLQLAVGQAQRAVDDRDAIRVDRGRPRQERDRRQRREIGRIGLQAGEQAAWRACRRLGRFAAACGGSAGAPA